MRQLTHRVKRFSFNIVKDFLASRAIVEIDSKISFFVSCSNGLYFSNQGTFKKVLDGNFFGITKLEGNRYLGVRYVQNGVKDERSFAETFELKNGIAVDRAPFSFRTQDGTMKVPVRVHQVVYKDGLLWVTNTRQNLIWKCDVDGRILEEFCYGKTFDYDKDSTDATIVRQKARKSTDYHHFNSIALEGEYLYLLAHNSAGEDKSKLSFYLKLDYDFNIIQKTKDVGKACHNLILSDDAFYICDSANGQLVHRNKPTVDLGFFLRGMAIANNCLIVGGTVLSNNPDKRGRSGSRIFFIPVGASEAIMSISLGRTGDIHDILVVDNAY